MSGFFAGSSLILCARPILSRWVALTSRSRESLQNERNSRHLFGKWRAQIKNELSAQWATLLQAGPKAYQPYIHGTLSPAFLATPQVAARIIAEAMLLRQEQRWAMRQTLTSASSTPSCCPVWPTALGCRFGLLALKGKTWVMQARRW